MRHVAAVIVLCAGSLAHAQSTEEERQAQAVAVAPPPTPIVGNDLRGQPPVFDAELVSARLTLRAADKTMTSLSVAPFLRAPYDWRTGEIRLAAFTETSGAFGFGASWGVSQARQRLATMPLGHDDAAKQALAAEQAKRRGVLAMHVNTTCVLAAKMHATCTGGGPHQIPAPICAAVVIAQSNCTPGAPVKVAILADQLVTALGVFTATQTNELYAAQQWDDATVAMGQAYTQLVVARDAFVGKSIEAAKKQDDAALKAARARRLEAAYRGSVAFNVQASTSLFQIVEAPDISPMMTMDPPRNAFAQRLRSFDLGAAMRIYPTRTTVIQARGGFRRDRVSQVDDVEMANQYYVALDVAGIVLFGTGPDEAGFQTGLGLGGTLITYRCLESGGCKTELLLGDQYPKNAPLEHRWVASTFLEWRLKKELQIRLAVDLMFDKVEGRIPGTHPTETDPGLRRLSPSLSIGTAFWGI